MTRRALPHPQDVWLLLRAHVRARVRARPPQVVTLVEERPKGQPNVYRLAVRRVMDRGIQAPDISWLRKGEGWSWRTTMVK